MSKSAVADLEKLGRTAAQQVAGKGVVKGVEVEPGEDPFERPIYYFSFLIEPRDASQRRGLLRIRLIQKLLDELTARGDEHYPVVRILNRLDWDRRKDARPN